MRGREVEELVRIARGAGAIVMDVYATDFSVAFKAKADPVTEADKRANAYIVRELRASFPGDGIVAEESDDTSDAMRGGRCWYVDPVDGTKEFVARNGEFAVMMGLAVDGAASAGVVYQPVTDKLYTGVVGQGATLQQHGAERELRVSEVSNPRELRLVVSRSHRNRAVARVVAELGVPEETQTGSVGLKAGLIAERAADLYLHISDKSSKWDACGPEAILRAAGGRFTDLAGKAYHYDGSEMRNRRGILACNAAAYDAVLPVARTAARSIGLID
jgi:3'(2'), 5'-bisphosphate nucleotidase